VLTERISRSSDLLAAPHRDLGEKLAPQARQVFRSLDEVRSYKVSGPTCRSASGRLGPLDRDLWDLGRWGPMGTHVSHAKFPTLT
jgi:hypothetical protein